MSVCPHPGRGRPSRPHTGSGKPAAEKRICAGCGETFDVRDPRQRYCDVICFEIATRKSRRWRSACAAIALLTVAMMLMARSFPARADSVTLTWSAPTANEDGSPLTDGEIAWYVLIESGGAPKDDNIRILPSSTLTAAETVTCGTAIFDVAALTASGSLGAMAETTFTVPLICPPPAGALYVN
jgi:hypothetical protein